MPFNLPRQSSRMRAIVATTGRDMQTIQDCLSLMDFRFIIAEGYAVAVDDKHLDHGGSCVFPLTNRLNTS